MTRPDLPRTGNENSSAVRRDERNVVIQRRFYDGSGRAIKNIDFDHDHGAGKPHAHDWDWTTALVSPAISNARKSIRILSLFLPCYRTADSWGHVIPRKTGHQEGSVSTR